MKNSDRQMKDDLLVKYLLGEASDTEQGFVQNWLAARDDNKQYFEHLRFIWTESKEIQHVSNVDENEALVRFKQSIEMKGGKKPLLTSSRLSQWIKIAAMLILLASGGLVTYLTTKHNEIEQVVSHSAIIPAEDNKVAVNKSVPSITPNTETIDEPKENKTSITQIGMVSNKIKEKSISIKKSLKSKNQTSTDEIVCNGTPCPIEICIIQTVKCGKKRPAQISTCSTIEPDQSGQLRYKALGNIGKNCALNVREIRIKRVSTGETIVLNAHSSPVTAQDLFGYITGQKKGDVVAGMFHTDCNNYHHEHGLQFDNNYGDLVVH